MKAKPRSDKMRQARRVAWASLNSQQLKAAKLVADDSLSDAQIAEQLGIHRATLDRWEQKARFYRE